MSSSTKTSTRTAKDIRGSKEGCQMVVPILRRLSDIRDLSAGWKRAGETVAVVPTMGALHAGHLSLVEKAKAQCDRVIVWIFVNPKQFNNPQDLENYPRTEHDDAQKLNGFGVDAIYVPDVDQVYPKGFSTTVSVVGLTDMLCGAHRPGHFDGVATVVSKIFLQTGADYAFFGEKDYQQLQIVRRMANDLDIPTQIIACPTVREPSGLAMSSRNLRLSPQATQQAAFLFPALTDIAADLRGGATFQSLTDRARIRLAKAGFDQVEYLDLRRAEGLAMMTELDAPARLFVAAWIDGVRLIDNIAV